MTLPIRLTYIIITSCLLLITVNVFALGVDLTNRSQQDTQLDKTRKPLEIINFVGVGDGDNVLDLLAGGGYYSELLSRVVGSNGKVTLQIPKAYLSFVGAELEQRLAGNRLKNVNYVLSEADNLKLEKNTFDSAFLILGYHDMFFKDQGWDFSADVVMPQVLNSLKIGGKLLLIDHSAAENRGALDTKTLHRIEADFVIEDMERHGFKLVKRSQLLSNLTDDRSASVFKAELRRKTDRFVLLFERTK